MDLYCVKCRTRTGTIDQTTTTTKLGRPSLTGECATCGTKKFRFFKKKVMEVTSLPNWQNSPELHGQNIMEKNIYPDIITVGQGHD